MPTTAVDLKTIFQIVYYVAILIFLIHTVVVTYHWHSFGADRKKTLIGSIIHIGVGSLILLGMGAALLSM